MGSAAAVGQDVERWGRFETSLKQAMAYANPFADVWLKCTFECDGDALTVDGFYDGDGTWKVRLMPTKDGTWTYRTESNDPGLEGKSGRFRCVPASEDNHGPIVIRNTYHFAYADGTPYYPLGTTLYNWLHREEELQEQTLATLRQHAFNKVRCCMFPKWYRYNQVEPSLYPWPHRDDDFDRDQFSPEYFQHIERRVEDLLSMGIVADLILFHPYDSDKWRHSKMSREQDDAYLRYVIARLAAYRNVWWTMANEYDLVKPAKDWDRIFQVVRDLDPYDHPRSNHNCRGWYDHGKPWVTHCNIQHGGGGLYEACLRARRDYGKPVVIDEYGYEGDIPQGWGNRSAQEETHRHWTATMAGAYASHGETYYNEEEKLWWSVGGKLIGRSPARLAFLRSVMEQAPYEQMEPDPQLSPGNYALCKPNEYYLVYFTTDVPTALDLPGDGPYKVDGIDPWHMTVTPLNDASPGRIEFAPPKGNYVVRLVAYKPGEKRRPQAKAVAVPTEGAVPLAVRFSGPGNLRCRWDFGDGSQSAERRPVHTYAEPGLYRASLTVTDEAGLSATAFVAVAADFTGTEPLVRVGFREDESHPLWLQGDIKRGADGSLDLGDGEPWKWVTVGEQPIEALEGLRSFTILGWVRPSSLTMGSGGNRIVFNLNYNRAGMDLVCLEDGRLRLAVNEWPDGVRNDSSADQVQAGKWTFFAVTYDGTKAESNVHWYFGDAETPATLDRTNSYSRGPTGSGSGALTIGNYNETIHRHGLDRQIRGQLRGIEIHGRRASSRGALSLADIRARQARE